MKTFSLSWTARWPPLPVSYALARGLSARALACRLSAEPERLRALQGVVSGDLLAVTGSELPWVDGIEYFGRDEAAPWLLLPTQWEPSIPAAWLERKYRAPLKAVDWPCLIVSHVSLTSGTAESCEVSLLPVGRAAPFDAAKLEAWGRRE